MIAAGNDYSVLKLLTISNSLRLLTQLNGQPRFDLSTLGPLLCLQVEKIYIISSSASEILFAPAPRHGYASQKCKYVSLS